MHMITEWMPAFHPHYSHRILYVGNDFTLSESLQDALRDCQIIRSPGGSMARAFIKNIKYSLLLFDEQLPDMAGQELADFTRAMAHRKRTPIIIVKREDNFELLARTIARLLAAS